MNRHFSLVAPLPPSFEQLVHEDAIAWLLNAYCYKRAVDRGSDVSDCGLRTLVIGQPSSSGGLLDAWFSEDWADSRYRLFLQLRYSLVNTAVPFQTSFFGRATAYVGIRSSVHRYRQLIGPTESFLQACDAAQKDGSEATNRFLSSIGHPSWGVSIVEAASAGDSFLVREMIAPKDTTSDTQT